MAYFYCGTEGADYENRYCANCIHGQDENKGCPVFSAHWLYSYQMAGEENKEHPAKIILDMLIPMTKGNNPDVCALFAKYVEPPPGALERGETPLFVEGV